jgi:nucleotide-binding universal stress UspA family protein
MQRAGLPHDAKALVISAGWDAKQQKATVDPLTEAACNRIQSQFPQWDLSSEALSGAPAEAILKASKWWHPDLLVIGAEAFPIEHARTASVSLELVHQARCTVRVVRTPKSGSAGPIRLVIGNGGSKACDAVIHEVARRQWPEDTDAHVITVIDPSSADEQLRPEAITGEDQLLWLRGAGLLVKRRLITGDPRHELVRESERWAADTIFVGPRRMPAASRFLLGSVATAVVTRARSTVEVVRH